MSHRFRLTCSVPRPVAAALAGSYRIDAKRLQARGVASLSPVASNAGDAGRAKNRRVEMVEQ